MTTSKALEILQDVKLNSLEEEALSTLSDMSDNTAKLLNEIVWMARRYADGRQTYAPSMFNEAYDQLKQLYGNFEVSNKKDITLVDSNSFPYASTGNQNTTLHSEEF